MARLRTGWRAERLISIGIELAQGVKVGIFMIVADHRCCSWSVWDDFSLIWPMDLMPVEVDIEQ